MLCIYHSNNTKRNQHITGCQDKGCVLKLSWPSTAEYRMMKLKKDQHIIVDSGERRKPHRTGLGVRTRNVVARARPMKFLKKICSFPLHPDKSPLLIDSHHRHQDASCKRAHQTGSPPQQTPAKPAYTDGRRRSVFQLDGLSTCRSPIGSVRCRTIRHPTGCETPATLRKIRRKHDVWIFTGNQAAIMKIRTRKPGPGQEISIAFAHISTELTALKCTLMWPGMKSRRTRQTGNNPTATCHLPDMYILEDGERMEGMVGLRPTERNPVLWSFPHETRQIFRTNNRALISTVTQLRTGHGYFDSYLYKIPTNNTPSDQCSCRDNPPQTPVHLILWCPVHHRARPQSTTTG